MSNTTTLIKTLRNGCGDVDCEDCQFSRKPYRMDFDCILCGQAADAIERLEAQLAVAMRYVPKECHTCKYWMPRTKELCSAPDDSSFGYNPNEPCWAWKWRESKEED